MLHATAATTARPACRRRKRRANASPKRRGAATVEMALVLPIFIVVVLGTVEFGRAMMMSQIVVNASREGARLAIVNGNSNADVTGRVEQFVTDSLGVPAGSVSVEITITPAPDNPNTATDVANAGTGDLVNVYVEVPFADAAYIAGKYLDGKLMHGETSMRHE